MKIIGGIVMSKYEYDIGRPYADKKAWFLFCLVKEIEESNRLKRLDLDGSCNHRNFSDSELRDNAI